MNRFIGVLVYYITYSEKMYQFWFLESKHVPGTLSRPEVDVTKKRHLRHGPKGCEISLGCMLMPADFA